MLHFLELLKPWGKISNNPKLWASISVVQRSNFFSLMPTDIRVTCKETLLKPQSQTNVKNTTGVLSVRLPVWRENLMVSFIKNIFHKIKIWLTLYSAALCSTNLGYGEHLVKAQEQAHRRRCSQYPGWPLQLNFMYKSDKAFLLLTVSTQPLSHWWSLHTANHHV